MNTQIMQKTKESTATLLKVSMASHSAVIHMVGDGAISMQAAFITNYIITKSIDRLMGACMVPASEIVRAMGVSSQSIAYKYINEAVDAGLLQAFKASGLATVYRPRYDNILQGLDPAIIGSDVWLAHARAVRKYESPQIMQTLVNMQELSSKA